MSRGNIDNLKIHQSSDEARKNGAKGGIASGKARKEKKKIKDAIQKALANNYKIKVGEEEESLVGYEAVAKSMILEAINGNVKAATFIRDSIGEKPKDVIDLDASDSTVSGITIEFVDKSNKKTGKEVDPKIVGEYTPPINSEED